MYYRVYVAGKFDAKKRLAVEAQKLRERGHSVVSRWLESEEVGLPEPRKAEEYAKRDLAEVLRCDVLVLDTLDDNIKGGREVEWGIAAATGKRMILVGPVRNVFHQLADEQYDTWADFWTGDKRRVE